MKNKAPGPDEIPVEFSQSCWDIVKNDIRNPFHDWHLGRLNFGMM
jgi:hypothetical protein